MVRTLCSVASVCVVSVWCLRFSGRRLRRGATQGNGGGGRLGIRGLVAGSRHGFEGRGEGRLVACPCRFSSASLTVDSVEEARGLTSSRQNISYSTIHKMTTWQCTVFSLPACPHCRRAKALLRGACVPFVDVDVSSSPARRRDMAKVSGR